MGCVPCSRRRGQAPAPRPSVPAKPRVTKFEVATAEGVKKFDTVREAQANRRPGALVRIVKG